MNLQLLVCAVSCLSAPLDQEIDRGASKNANRLSMADSYFQASQRRIGILYHKNTLVVAQCTFLTAVYLMSTMQILASWKCFVQAGTQCVAWLISQGQLKSDHSSITQSSNRHAEESLYWSCLKSEM
jgi:hypothetical protein